MFVSVRYRPAGGGDVSAVHPLNQLEYDYASKPCPFAPGAPASYSKESQRTAPTSARQIRHRRCSGIGAGGDCDGQVLVMHDMLGINTEFKPRFLRQYLNLSEQIPSAVQKYISDVKHKDFPNKNESY